MKLPPNLDVSEEDILGYAQQIPLMPDLSPEVRHMYMDYTTSLLTLKQQQKLLAEQNRYNQKQLIWTRVMAIATVVSVLVALGILKFNSETLDRNLNLFTQGEK